MLTDNLLISPRAEARKFVLMPAYGTEESSCFIVAAVKPAERKHLTGCCCIPEVFVAVL